MEKSIVLLNESSAGAFRAQSRQVIVPPFVSIYNTVQAAEVHMMTAMGAFCFSQTAESAFLAAVEPSNIFLKRSSLGTFVVEAHLKFHVPEPSILKPIELFIYVIVRSTEFPF
jgi:hypothetical protein